MSRWLQGQVGGLGKEEALLSGERRRPLPAHVYLTCDELASQGLSTLGRVLARPIFAPMKALEKSPSGAGGSLMIQALLKPMNQLASEPLSAKRPKSLTLAASER